MICFLSGRRLKPGSYGDFRLAWEPERWPPEASHAYHLRHKDDENVIVSFGLYEGTLADRGRIIEGHGGDERRLERIAERVEEAFEVVKEVDPRA